ncbi:11014_t:CDS:2, partial [Racocetra persica]
LAHLDELLPNNKSNAHKVPTTKVLKFDKVGNSTFTTIQLAKTKNHKTANRVSLIINPTNDPLCPICYAKDNMMLFAKLDRTWATKQWFIAKLKQLILHEYVAGHSLRAGDTTELVIRGVQLVLIQKIGR